MIFRAPHLLFFLPAYADQIDVHPASVSLLLSVCSVFDLVGRIGFGLVLDARIVNPNLVFSAVMFASTAAVFAVPNCHDVFALGARVDVADLQGRRAARAGEAALPAGLTTSRRCRGDASSAPRRATGR